MTPYDNCLTCYGELIFFPIAYLLDKDGSRFGFRLACKICGWFDGDRFYTKEEIGNIIHITASKQQTQSPTSQTSKENNKSLSPKSSNPVLTRQNRLRK